MKQIYLFFLFLFLGTTVCAQIKEITVKPPDRVHMSGSGNLIEGHPLYVVNGIPIDNNQAMLGILPDDIDTVIALKTSDLAFTCSPAKKDVVAVVLKKHIALLPLNKVLRKLNKRDRGLPVYLNNEKLISRSDFYLSQNRIKAIKVVDKLHDDDKKTKVIQISLKQ